jgi:hypothetical protein
MGTGRFLLHALPDTDATPATSPGISEANGDVVARKWGQNILGVSVSVSGRTLKVNQLVDMEWKFGVTAATNELKAAGATFLQLKLVIDPGNGRRVTEYMELSLPQFYHFLSQMENAKTQMDMLST